MKAVFLLTIFVAVFANFDFLIMTSKSITIKADFVRTKAAFIVAETAFIRPHFSIRRMILEFALPKFELIATNA